MNLLVLSIMAKLTKTVLSSTVVEAAAALKSAQRTLSELVSVPMTLRTTTQVLVVMRRRKTTMLRMCCHHWQTATLFSAYNYATTI